MIKEFSVENYRSIWKKQTISFKPNKKIVTGSEEYLFTKVNDSEYLLKLCVLYGYNASGKTNMLHALEFVRRLVLHAPETKDSETGFVPFAFDEASSTNPGTFFLLFYIDGIEYEYSIKLDQTRIYSEVLRYRPNVRMSLIYKRFYNEKRSVSSLFFGTSCPLKVKEKTILTGNTLENTSVLGAYRKSNIHVPLLETLATYFRDSFLPQVSQNSLLRNWSMRRLDEDEQRKPFYMELLGKADFQISNLEIKSNKIPLDEEELEQLASEKLPEELIEKLRKEKHIEAKELFFTHKTLQGGYLLSSEEESEGTMRFFGFGGVLQKLVSNSHFVAIDELETSLHPDLVSFFLQIFFMNSQHSQMLVTTHSQHFMDLDYMRNDMIWFCEKNETGASTYFSAQEFRLHKNVSLGNHYRSGKLGAKPILGSPIM